MGQKKDHEFDVRWLKAARRVLKPGGLERILEMRHVDAMMAVEGYGPTGQHSLGGKRT